MMEYTINNESGRISHILIAPHEKMECFPFSSIDQSVDYRFDFETNTWIYDPVIMIPQEITKLQCVKLLLDTNRYNDLMSALDADTTGVSRILFDAASTLSIDSNMVNQLATALGFSNEDTDAFFVEAEKIIV